MIDPDKIQQARDLCGCYACTSLYVIVDAGGVGVEVKAEPVIPLEWDERRKAPMTCLAAAILPWVLTTPKSET